MVAENGIEDRKASGKSVARRPSRETGAQARRRERRLRKVKLAPAHRNSSSRHRQREGTERSKVDAESDAGRQREAGRVQEKKDT